MLTFIWLVLVHTLGLITFILAHLLALMLQAWEQLCLAGWFVHWIWANLRGQTVLSRCVLEAHQLILREWSAVVLEDHEAAGVPTNERRGLTGWNIARGLLELFCIQDATWHRLLAHDEGLVPLVSTTRTWSLDDPAPEAEDEVEEELVLVAQDEDIVQLTRTPRLGPVRENSPSANDGGTHELHQRGIWEASTHVPALVRTLRWAAGLAISAYGLHVPITGLPPRSPRPVVNYHDKRLLTSRVYRPKRCCTRIFKLSIRVLPIVLPSM